MVGFIFGGNTGLSYGDLQDKRARADLLAAQILGQQPKTVAQGIGSVLGGIGVGINRWQTDKGMRSGREKASSTYDSILSKIMGQPSAGEGSSANLSMPGATNEIAAAPAADVSKNGSTFNPFIETVKAGGLTNPYGLAAVAATGRAESGWSPENAARSWSDPSESGQAGTSGGVMSWRAERLANLRSFASSKGEQGNGSPQTQAEFFMQEDPQLVAKLNAAKSPEEAQSLMNNAWKFAGYNRPGGEAGRRMGFAAAYAPQFQGQGETQVASLDQSIGMPGPAEAIQQQAPGSGYVDPMVSAPNAQPMSAPPMQPQFDMNRFGPMPGEGAMPQAPQRGARLPQMPMPAGPAMGGPQQAGGGLQASPSAAMPAAPPAASVAPQRGVGAPGALPPSVASNAPPMPQPGTAQAAQQPPAMGQRNPFAGVDPQIIELMNNPFLPDEQRQMMQMLFQQQMQANDPMRQLEMQKIQRELSEEPKRNTSVVNGRLVDNQTGQVIAEYPDAQKPTADQQNYGYYRQFEEQAGRAPLGPLEWEQAQRKAGATTVNNNIGESDKFYEQLDRKNAEMFATLSDGGMQARSKIGQIDRLEGLFANVPQGIEGGFKQLAGEWGVPIGEGVSDIQAASAMIERMVPEQRAPGSGPMSDADIKMFRSSLPRIINQPGGNQLIFQTLRGISEYDMRMGEIADAVADRTITPAEGRKRIRDLENPLASYKIPEGPTPNEGWNDVAPGIRFKRIGD